MRGEGKHAHATPKCTRGSLPASHTHSAYPACVQSEKTTLTENLGRDYGPQDEYVPLGDKCFEAKVR